MRGDHFWACSDNGSTTTATFNKDMSSSPSLNDLRWHVNQLPERLAYHDSHGSIVELLVVSCSSRLGRCKDSLCIKRLICRSDYRRDFGDKVGERRSTKESVKPFPTAYKELLPVEDSNIAVHRLKNIDDRLDTFPVLVRLQSIVIVKREREWSDGADKLINYQHKKSNYSRIILLLTRPLASRWTPPLMPSFPAIWVPAFQNSLAAAISPAAQPPNVIPCKGLAS